MSYKSHMNLCPTQKLLYFLASSKGGLVKIVRTVDFKSRNGNQYTYDNNSGQIFCCNNINSKSLVAEYTEKLGIYRDKEIKTVSPDDVYHYLVKEGHGFRQLILEVTSQCNFRCKYCTYSDCYEYSHGYKDDYMTFDTAKKTVDYYIKSNLEARVGNPLIEGFIGFYGGEPLLNFRLIKQVVQYIKQTYADFKVMYNITTNGYLLNDDIADFLVENDFAVLVSLDGNKEEHDRNRVTIGSKGTFDRVFRKISRFRKRYPDYEKLSISACYDFKTDLDAVKRFFEKEKLFIAKFAAIESTNTNYYDQFTQEDYELYVKRRQLLKDELLEYARKNELTLDKFVYQVLGVGYLELSFHCMIGDSKNPLIPYTGTCIPGEKLYVTPDEKIHMCEKINPNFSIGDVNKGLDYEKMAEMINEYNRNISVHCTKCEVNKLCSNCFAKFATDKDFIYKGGLCNGIKQNSLNNLVDYVNVLEEAPDLVDRLTVHYYDYIVQASKGGC